MTRTANKAALLMGMAAAMGAAAGEGIYDPTTLSLPSTPIYFPKKHTVMSYAKQNRLAKKRKNNKQKR